MPEPEQNRDQSGQGPNSDLDRLWDQLISPINLAEDIEKLRIEFLHHLSSLPEACARTDYSGNAGLIHQLSPLTALDRQLIGTLEERLETLIAEASGEVGNATIVGRFAYSDGKANPVRSVLVMLEDAQGLPLLYDGHTSALSRTQGAGLIEVFLDSKNAIFIRQHLSVETVRHEIGEFVANWPAYFRYDGESKTSPIASSLWKRVMSRSDIPEGVTAPDAVTLYSGTGQQDFHIRFDIDDLAIVVIVSCRENTVRPLFSDYVMDRPILDARLARLRPEMNEQAQWEFVPDKLLSDVDEVVFSSTLGSINRKTREIGLFFPPALSAQSEFSQRNEKLLSEFLYKSGEYDQMGGNQINRIDLLVRFGRDFLAPFQRSAVGVVATTRDGHFVMNSSYTRRAFEFGSAGVILLGGFQGVEQILPFYSQAAFREELGELMICNGADIDRLRGTSYLLNLVIRNCPGELATDKIKELTVTNSSEDLDRARITLYGESRSFSALIERVPRSGLVQVLPPFYPKALRSVY